VLTIEGDIARSSSLPSAEKDVRCGIFPRAFPCVGRGREGGERNGFLMRFFSFFFFLFSFSFFFFLFLLLNYSILTLLSNIYILFFPSALLFMRRPSSLTLSLPLMTVKRLFLSK